MITINELAVKFSDLATILDSIEVKGIKNVKLVDQAYELCVKTVSDLKETIEEIQNESLPQNLQKEGESIDGEYS